MYVSFNIIGRNIKQARKAAHLTQEQAAERVGLSALHYGRIERGQRQVSLKQLARIGTALGTPFEALLAIRKTSLRYWKQRPINQRAALSTH